jgi:hypothetical protein
MLTVPSRLRLRLPEFQGTNEQMKDVSKSVAALVKKHGGKDWSFAVSPCDCSLQPSAVG